MISYLKHLETKNKALFFKDLSTYTENLKVIDKLDGHKGCVNTIDWDKTGTKILSGGDDATLRIHQYMCDWDKPWAQNSTLEIYLPNSRNILSAKFMPIYNNKVVSASKCGSIFLVDIESTTNVTMLYKHTGPVLNIATIDNEPNSFISVSNDKTLCIFDIRESNPKPVVTMRFPCSLSAIAIHPCSSNKIATGGSDSFVRIFDRRGLNETNIDVKTTLKKVIEICRPLEFPMDDRNSNIGPFHYGRRYINSISFEPRFGYHMLVNYMYDSIYLFDTRQQEDKEPIPLQVDDSTTNSTTVFRIHHNWENTGTSADGGDDENSDILCTDSIQSYLNELQQEEISRNASKSSKNFIESQLKSAMRYKQIRTYDGHHNCRTMIKDTRFWGNKYILSGSECGHILIWENTFKYPIAAIQTDQRVTNRIEPHPFLPIIATCGIDYNVKIVGSTLQPAVAMEKRKEILKKILDQNQTRTEKAKKSQSISMMDLLRIMRAQRMSQRINDGVA